MIRSRGRQAAVDPTFHSHRLAEDKPPLVKDTGKSRASRTPGMRKTRKEGEAKKPWWLGPESNRRHCDFQSHALPTELPSHAGRGLKRSHVLHGKPDLSKIWNPVNGEGGVGSKGIHGIPCHRPTGKERAGNQIRSGRHFTPAFFAAVRSSVSSVASGKLARMASSR